MRLLVILCVCVFNYLFVSKSNAFVSNAFLTKKNHYYYCKFQTTWPHKNTQQMLSQHCTVFNYHSVIWNTRSSTNSKS